MEFEKAFEPGTIETRWYDHWQRLGVFTARAGSARPPFSMVIPPPNVTGRLHMGHALNNTLQDILARWRRMKGDDVLWLPGTDHAGIATQMVVDRQLQSEGSSRESLGREEFVRRVWRWKEEYGGAIIGQLKRLGCSCDWTRERFTMDEGLSRAVREAFVRLHEAGLIYRDKYIVNWCPGCRTAISDLEVIPQETQGHLYTVRYPFVGGGGGIDVATTRPETMLGDTGVAVHPDDARYRSMVGRRVVLPLSGREIPIVADSFVDKEFGTGAVKITPAHDANDFEAARRTGLPPRVVMDDQGRMNENVPERYRSLDRFEARRLVIEDLKAGGHLVSVQDHLHNVGRCQRCHTVIEPYLSTQWFVRVQPLTEEAMRAVADGRVTFTPPYWVNSYNEWMGKIHDWCISRQLWWGHQIPAWHCGTCAEIHVAREAPSICRRCGGRELRQDPDVLDTWFSSGLWPFSTLGWPEPTADLRRYYPTTVLVTGFDILFFWVSRMIMMGLHFMREVPFRRVYITGLVRDAEGQKMSKTRGNVVDPLELIDRYGADALRFTLAAMATPGSDLPLAEERMVGYRAFANKIWNAARFVLLNRGGGETGTSPPSLPARDRLSVADRWILSRLSRLALSVEASLGTFRFDEMSNTLYQFLWHEYCDWYLEIAKPNLQPGADPADAERARAVLLHVLDAVLRLLHPVMPFLTEDLWQRIPHRGDTIALAPYPAPDPGLIDERAEREIERIMEVVVRVRNIRAELNIDPGRRLPLRYRAHDREAREVIAGNAATIASLGRLESVEAAPDLTALGPAARAVVPGLDLAVPLAGVLDLEDEKRRLLREIDKLMKEREAHARKLGNAEFVGKAKPEAVAKARRIHRELQETIDRLTATVESLRLG
ncbi:MAG TPA: valine--tRNA ligase [Candidatus Polarisedimenticolia bacterium]|jgi:valyl-tRNA synthetase|nr:valine--tRNA ligase [Candidatus Polarisedimenticolia bacterium]